MSVRHFLSLEDISATELHMLIARASELAERHRTGVPHQPLVGRVLAMLFQQASTRTRLSFEAGMAQLGGHAIFLSPRDTQLGRGEPIADTARVIARMCDAIMVRAPDHDDVAAFAEHADVPVINALSDRYHPCQLLADLQTLYELRGELRGCRVAWIGDGNNMCLSWMQAARLLGFELTVAAPTDYRPDAGACERAGNAVRLATTPAEAAHAADAVVTDVWASMSQEEEQTHRTAAFADFQVDAALMQAARADAVFMHCLPAHRGEEVSAEVIDGPQSVIWHEAENRLHAQKALLEWLLT